MKEIVEGFKVELECLVDEMSQKLDKIICDTLVTMSFFEGSEEEHEAIIKNVLIELMQEKIEKALELEEVES